VCQIRFPVDMGHSAQFHRIFTDSNNPYDKPAHFYVEPRVARISKRKTLPRSIDFVSSTYGEACAGRQQISDSPQPGRVVSAFQPPYHGLGARTHAEFFVDAVEMILHRRGTDAELAADFLAR
jgi:hypothetical protein